MEYKLYLKKLFLSICCFVILPAIAYSYPNFIGFGYQSCLTCHYNPLGNGPLTDYGRGLGATVISDRIFYSKKTTDDQLGENSGFLYSKPGNDWLRPSVGYRGLYLKSSLGTNQEKNDIIHMQANFNLVLRLGPKDNKDKFFLLATFGYAPTPRANTDNTEDNWRTREHYIAYRPIQSLGFYLGLMDKAYGIRVPDHISFSRSSTSNTMNDQTHGLLLHVLKETYEISLQQFVGNLEQKENTRQSGTALRGEYSISKKTRVGASALSSKSNFVKLFSTALHSKMQFGKGSSSMLEVGETTQKIIPRNTETKSRYVMLQNHLHLKRGLHALVTAEYFKPNTTKESKIIRIGPGFQYFPIQSVELRLDVYNSRIFSDSTVTDDRWDLAGQLHLWF